MKTKEEARPGWKETCEIVWSVASPQFVVGERENERDEPVRINPAQALPMSASPKLNRERVVLDV